MIASAIQAAVTVVFGALAGGITNSLAIWMVFHPYQPPRIFGRRIRMLQGAIPKQKARLAAAIGNAVGTRLLTSDDLARTLQEPDMRTAFDQRLRAFLATVLERPRGALADELPPPLAAELRRLVDETAMTLLDRLDAYLGGDAFYAAARQRIETLADEIGDQEIGAVLTPEREAALTAAADRWLADVVAGDGFEAVIREYIEDTAERVLASGRTFEDLLPDGLVAALERAIESYLPLALGRLGGLLEEPDARERLERILHEILERFMRDLKFHQRIVAALVITPGTVERVLRAIEAEGATRIAEMLHDPAVRQAAAERINAGIADFLGRPVASVLGAPGDPDVVNAKRTIVDGLLSLARDDRTREFMLDRLRGSFGAAEHRTWGDLFRRLPPERLADAVVAVARSGEARAVYADALDRAGGYLMRRPIGRPADYLPADTADRMERAIAEPLWSWLQDQVPSVARRIDIAGRVEQKILDYPMERVEELIRSVTNRELHLIVRLGYLLGAMIGLVLVGVNALLG